MMAATSHMNHFTYELSYEDIHTLATMRCTSRLAQHWTGTWPYTSHLLFPSTADPPPSVEAPPPHSPPGSTPLPHLRVGLSIFLSFLLFITFLLFSAFVSECVREWVRRGESWSYLLSTRSLMRYAWRRPRRPSDGTAHAADMAPPNPRLLVGLRPTGRLIGSRRLWRHDSASAEPNPFQRVM